MPKIKVNDINLYYESLGQGEPIVFINGFTGDHILWRDLALLYSKDYRTIIFDNRGIGQSDCPDFPYTIEMMADDAAGLIQGLALGKVYVVGNSMGGNIVQALCYKYPEFIKSAVIANSVAKWSARAKLYAEVRLEFMQANTPSASITKYSSIFCWSEQFLSSAENMAQILSWGLGSISLAGYKAQMHALITFDSTSWVSNIRVPCLIIASDDDWLASIAQAKYLVQAIHNSQYFCFQGMGHVPQFEQPEVFNRVVLEFIAKRSV